MCIRDRQRALHLVTRPLALMERAQQGKKHIGIMLDLVQVEVVRCVYETASMKFLFRDGVRDFRYRMKEYRAEGNRLALVLEDVYYPLQVTLHYVVHEEEDILEKWREVKNTGTETVQIERFFSGEYTLPGSGYRSINNNGTWADEFKGYEDTLCAGKKIYESQRGATAHVATPAFIIHKDADETQGEVWFGTLAW